MEKITIIFWPILVPLRFMVFLWLGVGSWLYKEVTIFRDWIITETI